MCLIHIGESCIAIFVEVTLPYTFCMKTTHLKMFSELRVAENLVWDEQSLGNRAKLFYAVVILIIEQIARC